MERSQNAIPLRLLPAVKGHFTRRGFLLAIVFAPLVGLVVAWVAEVAASYLAPVILFPILVGIFAGLSIVGLARFAQVGHRPTIFLAVVLTAAVAAAAQHYYGYVTFYHSLSSTMNTPAADGQDLSATVREMAPSFSRYMQAQAARGRPLPGGHVARDWLAWLTWTIDAVLIVAAAAAVTLPALKVPYCNRCSTWYRTIRNGRIDRATALRLAEFVGVENVGQFRAPRYRLSACHGGCGPTRCELSWEEPDGSVNLVQIWLDAPARNQVAAMLDGVQSETYETES